SEGLVSCNVLLGCLRQRLHLRRRRRHVLPIRGRFLVAEHSKDRPKVVAVLTCDPISDCSHLIHDRIFSHSSSSSSNSSGVQMTGGRCPARQHKTSNWGLIIAFAMCVQFHVTRKSMP